MDEYDSDGKVYKDNIVEKEDVTNPSHQMESWGRRERQTVFRDIVGRFRRGCLELLKKGSLDQREVVTPLTIMENSFRTGETEKIA